MRILLLGLPGAGVSATGSLLGQRLGWPFLDDDVLRERTGSAAGALTLVMAMPGDLVAGIPDELVDDPAARERIASHHDHVVWLRCSTAVLVRRVADRLGPSPEEELRRLAAARHPHYEALATQVVDTAAHPAGAAANLVIEAVRGLS